MSSRALRKLQKEQELENRLAAVREAEAAQAEQDEESEGEEPVSARKPLNAFDMLDGMDEEEDEDEDDDAEPVDTREENIKPTSTPSQPSRPKKKKKKAKKKGKGKAVGATDKTSDIDDIEQALNEIYTKGAALPFDPETTNADETWAKEASMHLAIETKNLNPVNEMKSLFGKIALEGSSPARNQRRQEQDQAQQGGIDLGTALSGRQCAGTKGKELGPLAHRRNVFMQGKEEWPGASSGGLSMEWIRDNTTFEKQYNIMHDKYYQETQYEFTQCVQTMEPQNLISLLRLKPYHIATLLQVSEIAKVQGDHSVSGDLLERALFTFGRSVHSSFGVAIREGTARVTFSKSTNRELYLSIWRYIRNLEQRGTWKTAFEWAKLLLQLDPARDPYGVTLMIDQLALRGRQHQAFIMMCGEDAYGQTWNHLPNISISLALAYQRNKEPQKARQTLAVAMHKYSYILSALATSLEIAPLPKLLWGKLPSTSAETLYTQLYVTRAKDLWNTPELTSLLVEVASTMDLYKSFIAASTPAPKLEISLEEARHVLLLEIPALIGALPRSFTSMSTSMSDPLPPPFENAELTARAPAGVDGSGAGLVGNIISGAASGLLERIVNWFSTPAASGSGDDQQAVVAQLAEHLGVEPEEAQDMLAHFVMGPGDVHPVPGAFDNDTEPELGLHGGDRAMTMNEFVGGLHADTGAEDDIDTDSLPELETIPGMATPPSEATNPMVARVEDGEDDDDAHPENAAPTGALLRHVDSDEEDPMAHPNATHTIFASTSRNSTQAPIIEAADNIETTRDPQRIQRWLLSGGFDSIKNGNNMAQYVDRLKVLPKQQRDWTIRMVEQRGGKELAAQVREAIRE